MKNKHAWLIFTLISVLALTLAACSAVSQGSSAIAYAPPSEDTSSVYSEPIADEKVEDEPSSKSWDEEQPRMDEQGAIIVDIVALNLNDPGETLDFAVSLNTHSVDLSMDLVALAMLTTDTGLSVQALEWDAPSGGHHLSGKLTFPASIDNTPLLSGAQKLTLTLVNLDAPERIFVWEK
jgi:hypothetical protein